MSLRSWLLSLGSVLLDSNNVSNILYITKHLLTYYDLKSSEWLLSLIQIEKDKKYNKYIFTNHILDEMIVIIRTLLHYINYNIKQYDENISIIFGALPLQEAITAMFYKTDKYPKEERFKRINYLIQLIGNSLNKFKSCPLTSSILLKMLVQISNDCINLWDDKKYHSLILWLILYYILPSINYYVTNVKTLEYFKIEILTLDISYEILYDYILCYERDNNTPNELHNNVKYSTFLSLCTRKPELLSNFMTHITGLPKDYNNTLFLLLSRLAINNKSDYYYIVTYLLYYTCYISPITKNNSIDVPFINELLISLCNNYDISETIEFYVNLIIITNFSELSKDIANLITNINYLNWKPSDELLTKLLLWFEKDDVKFRELAYHMLSHCNWSLDEDGTLFIPPTIHRKVAIAIGLSDARFNYYKNAPPVKEDKNIQFLSRLTLVNPPKTKPLPLLFWEANNAVDNIREKWYINGKTDRLEEVCHSPSLAYVILSCTDYCERKGWMPLAILLQSHTPVAGYKIVNDCVPILTSKLLSIRSLISDARMALAPKDVNQCFNELAFLHRFKFIDDDKFNKLCSFLRNPGHRQHIKEAQEQLRKYFQTLSPIHLALLNFPNIQHFLCINTNTDTVDRNKERLLTHIISLQLYESLVDTDDNKPQLPTEHVIGFWMERIRTYNQWYYNQSYQIFNVINLLSKAAIYSATIDKNQPLKELFNQLYCQYQPFLYNLSKKEYPSFILKSDSWGKVNPVLNKSMLLPDYVSFTILYMETIQEHDLYEYFGKVMCNNMSVHDIDQLEGKLIYHYGNIEPDIKVTAPSLYLHKSYDNIDEFRIYTWAQYILLYPFDSPLFPLFCQMFFLLYFSSTTHNEHTRYFGHLFFIRGKKQSPLHYYKRELMTKFTNCVDEYKRLLEELDANEINEMSEDVLSPNKNNKQYDPDDHSLLSPDDSAHSVSSIRSSEFDDFIESPYIIKRRKYEMYYDLYNDMLTWLRNGEPGSWISFDELDPDSLLYKLCSTKIKDSSVIFQLDLSYLEEKDLVTVEPLWRTISLPLSDHKMYILTPEKCKECLLNEQILYDPPAYKITPVKPNIMFENAENWTEEQLKNEKPCINDIIKLLKLLRNSIITCNKNYNELYQLQDSMWDLASKFYKMTLTTRTLEGKCERKQCDPAKLVYSSYKLNIDLNVVDKFRSDWRKLIETEPSLYGEIPNNMKELSMVALNGSELISKMVRIIKNDDKQYSDTLQKNMTIEGEKWLNITLEIESTLTAYIESDYYYPCLNELYDMIFTLGKCCGSIYDKSPVEILQLIVCI